jgi:hypothetical protein
MLPEKALDMPLAEITTRHEARKPLQAIAFNERTIRHLSDLGIELTEAEKAKVEEADRISRQGEYLDRELAQELEKTFLSAYAGYLKTELGVEAPTVRDMLGVVLAEAGRADDITVYTYDDDLKREIGSANAKIAAQSPNYSRFGSIGMYETSYRFKD